MEGSLPGLGKALGTDDKNDHHYILLWPGSPTLGPAQPKLYQSTLSLPFLPRILFPHPPDYAEYPMDELSSYGKLILLADSL